jgi:hypothetical protein
MYMCQYVGMRCLVYKVGRRDREGGLNSSLLQRHLVERLDAACTYHGEMCAKDDTNINVLKSTKSLASKSYRKHAGRSAGRCAMLYHVRTSRQGRTAYM